MPSDVYPNEMCDPGAGDGALVQAARAGDRQAFALLYHRYKHDVWNLAYLTMRNHHEAEDCLQETFVKAIRALGSDRQVEAVGPWLLAICRNVCLDRLRALRRRHAVSLDDEEVAEPAALPDDPERRIDLRRALEGLAPEDREAFILVDVLGCRSHEAAAILGLRASSTLRSRLARARKQICPALIDDEPAAELWGLYHHPPDNAIVIAFGGHGNGEAHARQGELIARLERHGRARNGGPNGFRLVEFFDRLDDQIPGEQRVIAVIDAPPAGSASPTQHWLADHPRWQARRLATHAAWLLEVKRLLGGGAKPDEHQAAALAALETTAPFFWAPRP
jgi:RNA polymerase sigma-70 factor, ECF subfamily